jgi:hypothetical protein
MITYFAFLGFLATIIGHGVAMQRAEGEDQGPRFERVVVFPGGDKIVVHITYI